MRLARLTGAFALLLSASLFLAPACAEAVQPVASFEITAPLIALTFDDGPTNAEDIVAILSSEGAVGTMFVCGRRIGGGHELLYASQHGFEIGNHTWDHVPLSGAPLATDAWEIERTNAAIEDVTGERPVWVRAADGSIDQAGFEAVNDARQRYVNWDVHSQDSDWSLGPSRIERNVLEQAHPGAVVLLHATRPATLAALPGIVRGLQRRGYLLVTLSEMADVAAGRLSPDELPANTPPAPATPRVRIHLARWVPSRR